MIFKCSQTFVSIFWPLSDRNHKLSNKIQQYDLALVNSFCSGTGYKPFPHHDLSPSNPWHFSLVSAIPIDCTLPTPNSLLLHSLIAISFNIFLLCWLLTLSPLAIFPSAFRNLHFAGNQFSLPPRPFFFSFK